MSLLISRDLITEQEEHSAGAYQINFTDCFSRPSWLTSEASDQFVGKRYKFKVNVEITEGHESALSFQDMQRMACVYLMCTIPDEAVQEAYESLIDIFKFHRGRVSSSQPPAEAAKSIKAIITRKVDAQPLPMLD